MKLFSPKNLLILIPFFYLLILLFQKDLSLLEDLGRHLKMGEVVLNCKCVPQTNLFSYAQPDFPFVNHEWLTQVIFFLSSKLLGLKSILILKMILVMVSFAILYNLALKKGSVFWTTIISIPIISLFSMRFRVRPELFSYLFIALYIWIFERYKTSKNARLLWLLPFIQLFWVNMHIFFVLGIAMYGFFLTEQYFLHKKIEKQLLMVGITLIFVNFINPSFITGAILPFTVFSNYGISVEENFSPFTVFSTIANASYTLILQVVVFEIFIVFLLILFFIRNKRSYLSHILQTLTGALLGLKFIRCIGLFGLYAFLPMVQAGMDLEKRIKNQRLMNILKGILIVVTAFIMIIHIKGLFEYDILHFGYVSYGEKGVDFLVNNHVKGNIFNNYRIGSYLIYRLYPGQQVFIDSRPEAYPASFFDEYYRMMNDPLFFDHQVKKYSINAVVFGVQDENTEVIRPFLLRLLQSQEWVPVYGDGFVTILLKNHPHNKEIIQRFQIPL